MKEFVVEYLYAQECKETDGRIIRGIGQTEVIAPHEQAAINKVRNKKKYLHLHDVKATEIAEV